MAKLTAEIMEGDEESDLESFFIKACGLDLRDYHKDNRILTRNIFEKNFDKIMEIVERRDSRRNTYLVLGYFILLTGSYLPDDLKIKIIDASKWEHEKGLWDDKFVRERKFYLKDLRDKIRSHKPGVRLHLIRLKNTNDEDFTQGVIGLDQFWNYVDSGKIFSVKHINLDSCGLSSIPEPILGLKYLESLSLDHNKLKYIPKLIANLSSLKKLYLDDNRLQELPDAIGNLSNLEILFLERNQLKTLPKSIKDLKSLRMVYLRNNLITIIPAYLNSSLVEI